MSFARRIATALMFVSMSLAAAACADKAPASGTAATTAASGASAAPPAAAAPASTAVFGDFTMTTIDGQPKALSEYKGKVLLVVNTASGCGYTPQYEGLVKLHEKLKDKGFSVLGFPSNDFGGQEPGSDQEIKTFCDTKFKVSFPLFSKSVVKGPGKSPLYAFLTAAPPGGEIKWNFEKFLIGKDGKVAGRYRSAVTPDDATLAADIDAALAR